MDKYNHPFAAIIKPVDSCNMACNYCYNTAKSREAIMSEEVLRATISFLAEHIQDRRMVHFIWHGGEPLLLGDIFFKKVVTLQKEYCRDMRIDNCVQTNGTLLTENLLEFLIENKFSLSLSIDGPKLIHDKNRVFRDGSGTFDRVMDAVKLLKKHKQLVGAVVVMTKLTLPLIKDVYDFMKTLGIQFRINPIIRTKSNKSQLFSDGIDSLEYGKAMIELFDLWFNDTRPVHIDPLNLIVGNMISDSVWGCDFHGGCLKDIICVNPDGDLYPCGQLAGYKNFYLGNVLNNSVYDILNSAVYQQVRRRSPLNIKACASCEFVEICNAGCMVAARMRGKGIFERDYFCRGRKMLFSHIFKQLNNEKAILTKNTINSGPF